MRTGRGLEGVGCTKHDTASLDRVKTLPNHGYDGTGSHVFDETREESLALEVSVVYETVSAMRNTASIKTYGSRGARGMPGIA